MLAKATSSSQVKTGEGIITGGLVLQVIFFGFFLVVAGIFHYRISLIPTSTSLSSPVPWKKHLMVLYIASTLILIRSLFRIVEYIMGNDGPLLRSEVYLYVFDGTLMFLMMVVFAMWHPSQIIAGRTKDRKYGDVEMVGSQDGMTIRPK
jgi:RTA1 like protein